MQGLLNTARASVLTSCDRCNGIVMLCIAVVQTIAQASTIALTLPLKQRPKILKVLSLLSIIADMIFGITHLISKPVQT